MSAKNVLGTELEACCFDPMTGFFRDGFCKTREDDHGSHTVCAICTDEFLTYSKAMGNDLSTSRPEYNFPGLKAGDKWCVCASRWLQAYHDGLAPDVVLEACHERALEIIEMDILKSKAVNKQDHS